MGGGDGGGFTVRCGEVANLIYSLTQKIQLPPNESRLLFPTSLPLVVMREHTRALARLGTFFAIFYPVNTSHRLR